MVQGRERRGCTLPWWCRGPKRLVTAGLLLISLLGWAAGEAATLVGRWTLDNVATDSSGNGLTLTLVNAPAYTTSAALGSHALTFVKASNQYASRANAAVLNITGAVSITLWVNPPTLTPGANMNLMSKSACPSTCTANFGFGMLNTSGKIEFYFTNPANTYHTYDASTATLTAGVWNHVGVTYDDTANAIVLYLNGEAIAGTTTGGSPTTTSIVSNSEPLYIGAFAATADLGATMDDVRLYSGPVLSASEIMAIYTEGKPKRRGQY